ncbi:uncharacterized protein EV420DRAFT_1559484, partial [Desarmillaria tabescens]
MVRVGIGSLLLSLVMITLGRITGLIAIIPHVENGGCIEMRSISDLGQVVGSNVGIGQGWQQHGNWCLTLLLHCVLSITYLRSSIDLAQMDVAITAFVGCQGPNLAPALLLTSCEESLFGYQSWCCLHV